MSSIRKFGRICELFTRIVEGWALQQQNKVQAEMFQRKEVALQRTTCTSRWMSRKVHCSTSRDTAHREAEHISYLDNLSSQFGCVLLNKCINSVLMSICHLPQSKQSSLYNVHSINSIKLFVFHTDIYVNICKFSDVQRYTQYIKVQQIARTRSVQFYRT